MADQVTTSSGNEEQVLTNRKTRSSSISQAQRATPKRKRGRPRFEIHDGSAADRRRTQIREAQRAYRQRKESTLDELRGRISELTDVIEHMNRAFLNCCDQLTASHLSAKSTHDIQETSAQFRELMKRARASSDQNDREIAQSIQRTSPTSASDSARSGSSKFGLFPPDDAIVDAACTGVTDDDLHAVDWARFDQHGQPLISSGSRHQASCDRLSTSFMPPSIEPPVTYNFQETTFGRRLHRSCMEQSYQLILDPDRRPAMYQQVFELCLLRRDRSILTSALKSTLSKGSHECLHTSLPLIHIGGAGTHYPRRDSYGNLRPKRRAHALGKIGPQMLALLEHAALQDLTTDMTVDLVGYEGEWLDSYDVEGYLNEKGIFIDPSSSFAEIEVAVPGPAQSPTSSTDNRLSSGVSSDSFIDLFEGFEQHVANDSGNDVSRGSGLSESRESFSGQEKRTTVIDVTRFVNLLTASRVCLGWCPGFKRRDVDRALAMSSLDAL